MIEAGSTTWRSIPPPENLVDPEAVEARLLDEDKWEDLPVLIRAFSEVAQALQEPGDIAASHRVFRHLR